MTGTSEVQAASRPAEGKSVKHKPAKKKVHQTRKPKAVKEARRSGKAEKRVSHSYSPRQKMAQSFDEPADPRDLSLKSSAALVLDQKTGETLYSKNVNMETPIASITKLMTAMVTLDAGLDLDEEITITQAEVDRLKGTSSRLAVGARLTRGELMHLALIASENRAAAALSRVYPGGRDDFIAAMNRKAQTLGMKDTQFVDGTGLNSSNRSTAADLAKMVDAAYRYPLIRRISTSGSFDVAMPGTKVVRVRENGKTHKVAREVTRHVAFNNTNALTRADDWEIGVSKTGYINEAGHCLVMQANIAEQKVIIVLLDSWGKWSRIGDATRIRKWLENGAGQRLAARDAPSA
ncbi:MAG: serine hydrolase [Betaproteobacteria bacterium]|nr:serine hydrolase [Betaproteobacteria bacterium]